MDNYGALLYCLLTVLLCWSWIQKEGQQKNGEEKDPRPFGTSTHFRGKEHTLRSLPTI